MHGFRNYALMCVHVFSSFVLFKNSTLCDAIFVEATNRYESSFFLPPYSTSIIKHTTSSYGRGGYCGLGMSAGKVAEGGKSRYIHRERQESLKHRQSGVHNSIVEVYFSSLLPGKYTCQEEGKKTALRRYRYESSSFLPPYSTSIKIIDDQL